MAAGVWKPNASSCKSLAGNLFEITTFQHISTRLDWIHQSTPLIEQPLIRGTDSIYGIPIYLFSRIHRNSILKIVDRLNLSMSSCYLYFMCTYISDGGVGGYVGCMYKSHFSPVSCNFSHFSCCCGQMDVIFIQDRQPFPEHLTILRQTNSFRRTPETSFTTLSIFRVCARLS